MRAREFIIKIDVDDMGEPDVSVEPMHHPQPVATDPGQASCGCDDHDHSEPEYDYTDDPETPDADDEQDVMVTPQQQEIELQKAALGKKSIVAAQLTDDPEDDEIS